MIGIAAKKLPIGSKPRSKKLNLSAIKLTINAATQPIIYPDREVIETDKFATILTPNSKTSGNGVIADMKKGQITILSNAKRLSVSEERTEQLEGETMLYDLSKKTWVLLKKEMQDDKIKIKDRVKTILKTRKAN